MKMASALNKSFALMHLVASLLKFKYVFKSFIKPVLRETQEYLCQNMT